LARELQFRSQDELKRAENPLPPAFPCDSEEDDMMRKLLLAALAATGLCLFTAPASAQALVVTPGGQGYVQYYTPYAYGNTSYYYYPNSGYAYSYPSGVYTSSYVGPTVYGPGYTASYPYMYNQYNYGYSYPYNSAYYSPGYTTYRTWRWR
jgi:hypothetical protein